MRTAFESFCEIYKDFIDEKIAAKIAAAEDFIRTETEARVRRESETRIRELEAEIARLKKNN